MSNPQQPDFAIPVDNRPGHHPADEQDKPDLDAFAHRLGVAQAPEGDVAVERAGRTIVPAAAVAAVVAILAAVLALVTVRRRRGARR